MVDYNGLENRRAERHRGFESLSLRQGRLMFSLFFVFINEDIPASGRVAPICALLLDAEEP